MGILLIFVLISIDEERRSIDSALPLRMTMDEKVLQEFDGIVYPDSPS